MWTHNFFKNTTRFPITGLDQKTPNYFPVSWVRVFEKRNEHKDESRPENTFLRDYIFKGFIFFRMDQRGVTSNI